MHSRSGLKWREPGLGWRVVSFPGEITSVARCLIPSSFECDCGHRSHFFESTVNEMEAGSRRGRKLIHLWDSEAEEHAIEFRNGRAVAVICPRLGRLEITGWS
jgi:hypothetical protein